MKNVNPSDCFKKHPMQHTLLGLGLGILLVGLIPDLGVNAVIIGLVVAVVAFASEFVLGQT